MSERLITACPDCDGTSKIHRRTQQGQFPRSGDADARWICGECDATFDEPVERAPKGAGNLTGYADILDQADPDDVLGGREVADD